VSGRFGLPGGRRGRLRPASWGGRGAGEGIPRRAGGHAGSAPGRSRGDRRRGHRTGGDHVSDTLYAYYPVFRSTADLRSRGPSDVEGAAHESEILLKEWSDRVTIRGVYSTAGFRPDADLMMWW